MSVWTLVIMTRDTGMPSSADLKREARASLAAAIHTKNAMNTSHTFPVTNRPMRPNAIANVCPMAAAIVVARA